MEAFILDIALKISFGRFGRLPRSDFFIIDEGVSVIDQEKIINLSNLFEFLLSFNERVYIMSHLPIVKDFVQNRIEIDKEEKTGKSFLKIFY
jgi:DNA repair exonuclease SbcCD ATPase subunit